MRYVYSSISTIVSPFSAHQLHSQIDFFFDVVNWLKFIIYRKWRRLWLLSVWIRTFGEGSFYIRGLLLFLSLDALLTDEEPIFEPIEWSLVQTWLFFIFLFAWIGENLISSRFGSYTGRDKRIWFAWYKSFWLIEIWYLLSLFTAALFVIVPFYYELTYQIAFIVSWWDWINRIFFAKFIFLFSIVMVITQLISWNLRNWNYEKILLASIVVVLILSYMLYWHFITSFFAYFTDPIWYQKTRFNNSIQLSHEPLKWGWGTAKRDHFTYHRVSTVFWYKNDTPFSESLFLFNLFIFLTLFFVLIFWLTLVRRIWALQEFSQTFVTYCLSTVRQFFFLILSFYLLIGVSYLNNFWRFPLEFLTFQNKTSWISHFASIWQNLFFDLLTIFK
jgi:hypothetical protein